MLIELTIHNVGIDWSCEDKRRSGFGTPGSLMFSVENIVPGPIGIVLRFSLVQHSMAVGENCEKMMCTIFTTSLIIIPNVCSKTLIRHETGRVVGYDYML